MHSPAPLSVHDCRLPTANLIVRVGFMQELCVFPLQKVTEKAQSIITGVKCPSETATLGSLFPAALKRVETPCFDLTAESVVRNQRSSPIRSHPRLQSFYYENIAALYQKGREDKCLRRGEE